MDHLLQFPLYYLFQAIFNRKIEIKKNIGLHDIKQFIPNKAQYTAPLTKSLTP